MRKEGNGCNTKVVPRVIFGTQWRIMRAAHIFCDLWPGRTIYYTIYDVYYVQINSPAILSVMQTRKRMAPGNLVVEEITFYYRFRNEANDAAIASAFARAARCHWRWTRAPNAIRWQSVPFMLHDMNVVVKHTIGWNRRRCILSEMARVIAQVTVCVS